MSNSKPTSFGVPTNLTISANDDGTYKASIQFQDSGLYCEIPISEKQYKLLLDCINKNFLGSFATPDILYSEPPEAPDDSDIGLLSGLRYMIPVESMNAVYSSADRENRIIMISVEPQKDILSIFRVSSSPTKNVITTEIPIKILRTYIKDLDFRFIEIKNDGKIVKFGDTEVTSIDVIKLSYRKK